MSADFSFAFDGRELERLERDLRRAVGMAPERAKETLLGLAKEFRGSASKRAKKELKHEKRDAEGKKYAIARNWGHKLVGDRLGAAALVWNKAPHFHLVENGHVLVKGGRAIGFVPGKHIMEKTRHDFKDIVLERFEKMVDDIFKEYGL